MPNHISEDELLSIIKQFNMDSTQHPDKDEQHHDKSNEQSQPVQNGWIEVENNKIMVHDPSRGGQYPVIESVHPVKLIKNGKYSAGKETVRSSDKIEWEIDQQPLFTITVSEDKMFAYFHLISTERYAWHLKNKQSSQHIIVEAEEDKDTLLENLHLSDVLNTLKGMSIDKNLDPSSIYQELQNPTQKPVVVAKGVPMVPSVDAKLELYFSNEVESSFEEIGGVVDYRNHLKIPSVQKGDLIAKKSPLTEGAIGYDVFGKFIKPNPPIDIIIIARDHVEITLNGEVIALKEGRPRLTGNKIKQFDITTSYVVPGDVNLKTGNIIFSGDVIVYGNVTDGMIIETLGNVYVFGSVYRATITATGGIQVKGNIVGSNLYSGYFGVIFNRLYTNLKKLNELVQNLIEAAKVITKIIEAKGKNIGLGQVIITLIESKYKDIPQTAKEILFSLVNIREWHREEIHKLKSKVEILLHPMKLFELYSFDFLYGLNNQLQETCQSIEQLQETLVKIDINQCHLSTLKSNGDIMIRQEGVLQSNLYSRGNIIFFSSASICRGSRLEAEEMISAYFVSGATGGEVLLKAGKKILLKKMYYGRVSIRKFFKDIFEPIEDVVVYANNRQIVIEKTNFI